MPFKLRSALTKEPRRRAWIEVLPMIQGARLAAASNENVEARLHGPRILLTYAKVLFGLPVVATQLSMGKATR
jgi:hypothetical protein